MNDRPVNFTYKSLRYSMVSMLLIYVRIRFITIQCSYKEKIYQSKNQVFSSNKNLNINHKNYHIPPSTFLQSLSIIHHLLWVKKRSIANEPTKIDNSRLVYSKEKNTAIKKQCLNTSLNQVAKKLYSQVLF